MWISPPARSAPGCEQRRAVFSAGRLGRTRRLSGDRARQFRAALSPYMGDRARVIETFVRRVREAEKRGLISLRFRHRVNELTSAAAGRSVPGNPGAEPRNEARHLAREDARIRPEGAGRHRDIRGHRRQYRDGAEKLAGTPRQGAELHALGRAGLCRWPDADDHRGSRRQRHQSRPHVALYRGHRDWARSGAATASASFRTLAPLVRCARAKAADTAVSRFRHARHIEAPDATGHDYSWFVLNQRIIGKEFGLSGSEQNPDLTGKSWEDHSGELQRGRSGRQSGATIPAEGRGFRHGGPTELVKRMNTLTGSNCSNRRRCGTKSRRATARSTTHSARTRRSPPSAARAITLATG